MRRKRKSNSGPSPKRNRVDTDCLVVNNVDLPTNDLESPGDGDPLNNLESPDSNPDLLNSVHTSYTALQTKRLEYPEQYFKFHKCGNKPGNSLYKCMVGDCQSKEKILSTTDNSRGNLRKHIKTCHGNSLEKFSRLCREIDVKSSGKSIGETAPPHKESTQLKLSFEGYPKALTQALLDSYVGSSLKENSVANDSSSSKDKSIPPTSKGFLKIYTKTGDSGMTSTFTGERRAKDDNIFQALGAVDELASCIGLAREFGLENGHPYTDHLQRIQCILQDVNACIATPYSSAREAHLKKTEFDSGHVEEVEEWIDSYTNHLPPLENFILPGGGKASSSLHVARTVCRRAERAIVPIVREQHINPETLKYVNRLSDLLFTLARYAAKLDGRQETVYIRPGKK
ncbi:uncharacterized protein LOC124341140 isoform X2 [Daphnia pulicaria]|uniref:uncharacterized protein LOC124341140 isoform X2 n=1 Tax=Daphnia pulicaria TaxID=35523 RepID=UPI001EEB15CB|nr:uncharacterized protein LOC124341140 isoform X2 [Daphnia pulicaria]